MSHLSVPLLGMSEQQAKRITTSMNSITNINDGDTDDDVQQRTTTINVIESKRMRRPASAPTSPRVYRNQCIDYCNVSDELTEAFSGCLSTISSCNNGINSEVAGCAKVWVHHKLVGDSMSVRDTLLALFSSCGNVIDFYCPQTLPFCYIEFASPAQADQVINLFQGGKETVLSCLPTDVPMSVRLSVALVISVCPATDQALLHSKTQRKRRRRNFSCSGDEELYSRSTSSHGMRSSLRSRRLAPYRRLSLQSHKVSSINFDAAQQVPRCFSFGKHSNSNKNKTHSVTVPPLPATEKIAADGGFLTVEQLSNLESWGFRVKSDFLPSKPY